MAYAYRSSWKGSAPVRGRWRLLIPAALVLNALHVLLLGRLSPDGVSADLFSLFALYVGLYASREGRYGPCLVLGLMRDACSLGLLGSYAVLYALLYKFASRARERFHPDNPLNALGLALVGVFLVNFGYHGMLALSGGGIGWTRATLRCLEIAAYTALPAPIAFPLLHRLLAWLGFERSPVGLWNF